MSYCPNCHNILDVSKNPPTNNTSLQHFNAETPSTVSDENDEEKHLTYVDEIVNKLLDNETVTNSMISNIRLDQITKSATYQDLAKKQKSQVQTKYAEIMEKIGDSINAYYFCKNCLYSKPIDAKTLIIGRISAGTSANYVNIEKLQNKRHSQILPYTRNYICVNSKCDTNSNDSNKKKTKEAVFYRIGNSLQVMYTCTVCGTYWKGS